MTVQDVLIYPDPRLRSPADVVQDFGSEFQSEVDDLLDTFGASSAIGLCAPQIAVPKQVMVLDLSGRTEEPKLFVNPAIVGKKSFGVVEERCLSVPDAVVLTWRATNIFVRAQDRSGESFETELSNMEAVCLQHELEHFEGQLLVDKMFFLRRAFYRWRQNNRAAAVS